MQVIGALPTGLHVPWHAMVSLAPEHEGGFAIASHAAPPLQRDWHAARARTDTEHTEGVTCRDSVPPAWLRAVAMADAAASHQAFMRAC